MKIHFYVRFSTEYGQRLSVGIENGKATEEVQLEYLTHEWWTGEYESSSAGSLSYHYKLFDSKGNETVEWEKSRKLDQSLGNEFAVIDTWNHAGTIENAFYTAPFQEVFLKQKEHSSKRPSHFTHIFRVKAPLLKKNEVLCITGNQEGLGNWNTEAACKMSLEGEWWTAYLELGKKDFPLAYKYGVFDIETESFVKFESGNNRLLHANGIKRKTTVVHDGFAAVTSYNWKGAGVAIPVFSLKTRNSFGVGEFSDLKLLVDWAKETGLKLIQLLPVNDTIATHSWTDSYPYAAISAFALHPLYINIEKVAGKKNEIVKALRKKQKQLNSLPDIDYEQVMKFKLDALREIFNEEKKEFRKDKEFISFFENNRHWLVPYAAFSYLRDKYKTPDFNKWRTFATYDAAEINKLAAGTKAPEQIAFYYFLQYHLHLQLEDATNYAHKHGVVIKGDIPIGIYRYSVDAWMNPELYNMDQQAGAPPDDFAVKGQNWGFPTYNWKRMQQDGFQWWKQRFCQMSHYFDAFRIDHILGFFRIWSIPAHAVEGIMGHFIPAIPVHANEFGERGIWFDYERFCTSFITDELLWNVFGDNRQWIIDEFLVPNERNGYDLKPEFDTQQKIAGYFKTLLDIEENRKLKEGLFDLISNVIFFEETGSEKKQFHFRISMERTYSFQQLDAHVQHKLKELYVDYFFRRQDDFWKNEAMHKLPELKRATNMLVCGEDLGMVPHCVPEVMDQLGLLSLEIQRMPKDPQREFFHPNDAPYLSVITPSTHDMSTIRGWWEEDRQKTQRFFETLMGGYEAPVYCEPWINRAVIMQHMYSPAMWSIFQIQDLLGMSSTLRRENPHEERINIPANAKHYWKYRMHIDIEDLIKEKEFNDSIKELVKNSGRS